ncbi:MAG: PIN domain-containing protein [Taibaiella sp.]|nr:PIN domain-containing protein [Taibaiella sp.]
MKVYIDANVIVSVLNKEYPAYLYTSRILSLADNRKYTLVTSAVALAIAYYFAEKKHGAAVAKNKIKLLTEHIHVADCGMKEATLAATNKKIHDFENGLQYYAALHAGCKVIVTDNTEDFYFSDIEVLQAEQFFLKHM